ncbi:hypothetical protein HPB48_004728 [Haemaphysalis longicornis]|uniref:Uncharacterized protein n=1 Tax=Haemaphysalis longicornis TaxID=44386 RepID=A0A9J6G0E9_HAELO|nr:hypothetical protein HPB48_004728 [Haemaphysalis longicornis]
MSKGRSTSSNAAVKFLKRRVQSNQGISLQELYDHLCPFAASHEDKGKVYVRRRKRRANSTLNGTGFMATTSHSCTDEDDVTCLTDVAGRGLRVGDYVTLDAKVGPKECEARFRASRVTRAPVTTPSSSPCPSLHGNNDGKRRNTVTNLVNQLGVIERVKPSYGIIKFGRHERKRAFFHADTNLADVFTVGDQVRFNAKRIKKPSGKVRCEATTVHLCRSDDRSCSGDSEGQQSGNEVFMPKLDHYDIREADLEEPPARCAERDAISVKEDSSNPSVEEKKSVRRTLSEWEGRRDLAGERGFFYPVTETVGTVKFGPRRSLTAAAAVEVTYREMKVIDNLLWEVADGQEVRFDAVQEKDNKWIVTLVWIGQRPETPLVGDSGDISNRIPKKIFGREISFPRAEPGPSGDFSGEKPTQNVGPGSSLAQISISIYKDAKGKIVKTRKCNGTCEVRERTATRKIEFTIGCFYKNGTVFKDDLNEGLREGDTVFLDYMVGVKGTREELCCDLVWQGRRPRCVWQMSAEEFALRLQIDTQDAENSLCFEDRETEIERVGEASRGPFRGPSYTELPEDTMPSIGGEASRSPAFLPVRQRQRALLPGCSPLEHTMSCQHVTVLRSCRSLRQGWWRLEFVAQKVSLRVVLRDVGVQTVDGGPSSRPDSKLLVPCLRERPHTDHLDRRNQVEGTVHCLIAIEASSWTTY